MPEDRSFLNKIDPQTQAAIDALVADEDPVVSVAVEWARTPSSHELRVVLDLGGVWQGGATPAQLPSSIQTLRLPLRAVLSLARLGAVASVTASQPLGGGAWPNASSDQAD